MLPGVTMLSGHCLQAPANQMIGLGYSTQSGLTGTVVAHTQHGSHALPDPAVGEYQPTRHWLQVTVPSRLLEDPCWHILQAVLPATGPSVPTWHRPHLAEPSTSLKWPWAHCSHCLPWDALPAYVPAAHAVHTDLPAEVLTVPATNVVFIDTQDSMLCGAKT